MKARDVVGARIVKVAQERFWDEGSQKFEYDFHAIHLDNGKIILFAGDDDGSENFVRAWVVKKS
jgi:hypothetical protein